MVHGVKGFGLIDKRCCAVLFIIYICRRRRDKTHIHIGMMQFGTLLMSKLVHHALSILNWDILTEVCGLGQRLNVRVCLIYICLCSFPSMVVCHALLTVTCVLLTFPCVYYFTCSLLKGHPHRSRLTIFRYNNSTERTDKIYCCVNTCQTGTVHSSSVRW